jgi:23S rRNA pseudouridine1911/1915/1917 synthase
VPSLSLTVEGPARRLDAYLASRLQHKGLSRSALCRLIDAGKILLDGKPAKPSAEIRAGQRVEVDLPEDRPFELVPREGSLTILYEDEACLAVDKPSGLVTHPAKGHWDDTLLNVLAGRGVRLSGGSEEGRPGIVHRLDKDTSGVLLLARTEAARLSLMEQFKARKMEKVYWALVWGRLPEEEMEVAAPVGRDPRHRTRMAVVSGGREACTVFRTLEVLPHVSLVEARPRTGRTHQIRVHLAHVKHPVVGDSVYGGHPENGLPAVLLRNRVREAGRFFLHARRLTFESPASGRVTVLSPLPPEFQDLLEVFRRHG